jgi:hypothetical protein
VKSKMLCSLYEDGWYDVAISKLKLADKCFCLFDSCWVMLSRTIMFPIHRGRNEAVVVMVQDRRHVAIKSEFESRRCSF